ncbi:MAG: hypothetical protein FIB01_06610 [Gemmatimonadetes bacterium]|nr:hypothetical protein [Gemmatimonadota bacterium]
MRYRVMLPVWLALAPLAGSAQQPTERPIRATAEARVQTALQTALQAGIPVSLLESKVAEGKAKGVPMERIALAVENRLQALTRARTALQNGRVEAATDGDLAIAADAVQAGVSDNAIAEVARTAPRERRAVAVAVLTNLVAMGRASDQALAAVQAAMGRGPEALLKLQSKTAAQMQGQGMNRAGGVGVGADASAGARGGVKVDPPGKKGGKGGG